MARTIVAVTLFTMLLTPHVIGSDLASLPLLPPGFHLSVLPFGTFEPPAEGTQDLLQDRLDEALERGMFTVAYELDWVEIEPTAGRYELDRFTDRLDVWAAQGMTSPYVNISLVSIDSLTVPADLLDPDDPESLIDGRQIDDPLIVGRYLEMLDRVLPLYLARGGWVLMVGNEVDIYFEEDPDEALPFIRFVAAVADHAHEYYPGLPVGVVLTATPAATLPGWYRPLREASDVAGWNVYGQNEDFSLMTDPASVRERFDRVVDASADLPILIQELGASSGYEDGSGVISGTIEEQAQVARLLFQEVRARTQIRWASWFKMVPFSPVFAEAYGELIRTAEPSIPEEWLSGFVEVLRGYGLCRWTDGTAKPAWDEFLWALRQTYPPMVEPYPIPLAVNE